MNNIITTLQKNIDEMLDHFRHELSGIRTGRASSILVENIMVDSYGSKIPLKQLANISVNPPKEITVQVWDKSMAASAAKAIEDADLGITPNVDGNVIHLNLPPLTIERRKELTKHVGKLAEERKITVRRLRDEANKEAEELGSEDDRFRMKEDIQEVVDKTNKQIAELTEKKIAEINE